MKKYGYLLFLLLILRSGLIIMAEMDFDPKPPLKWDELLNCKLVIIGQYESHYEKTLSLKVTRVLKGEHSKAGDIIKVSLEHRYSIQTGPEGQDIYREDIKEDDIPKLCYEMQHTNPGSLIPTRCVPDVREAVIYFFPDETTPQLVVRNQVQPPIFADGWAQTLAGKPMSLFFRLLQTYNNPPLAREALEELYATRDSATLKQLFDLAFNPISHDYHFGYSQCAEDILSNIGDKEGDVYNPLLKMLKEKTPKNNDYSIYTIGRILARSNRAQSFKDFSEIIKNGPDALKKVAVHSLGYIGTEKALMLTFDLLKDEQLSDAAVWAIRTLLGADNSTRSGISSAEFAHLREIAIPKLISVFADHDVDESYKNNLKACFGHLLPQKETGVDIDYASKILLDPDAETYHGWTGNESSQLFDKIKQASNPVFVPLLVKILKDIAPASESHAYGFQETIYHYALMCPNLIKNELINQGLIQEFRKNPPDHGIESNLLVAIGLPISIDQLENLMEWDSARHWIEKKDFTPELITDIRKDIAYYNNGYIPPHNHLELFLQVDYAATVPLLELLLTKRNNYTPLERCKLLSLAIKYGHNELVPEFLGTIPPALDYEHNHGGTDIFTMRSLLTSGDKKAYEEYLKILDNMPKKYTDGHWHQEFPNSSYTGLVNKLLAINPRDYFNRIFSILESDSLVERETGERALNYELHYNFGFNSEDFAAIRAEKLDKLKPIFKKLSAMSEMDIRACILREHGINLEGTANRTWIPPLTKAIISDNATIYINAIILIEEITETYGCYELLYKLEPNE